jgi:hypothetical protein
MPIVLLLLIVCSHDYCIPLIHAAHKGPPPLTLRVRLTDGSIQRMVVSAEHQTTKSLREILWPLMDHDDNGIACPSMPPTDLDDSQTLSQLGMAQGTLLTLSKTRQLSTSNGLQKKKKSSSSTSTSEKSRRFNPFPELAKDYDAAMRRHHQRRKHSSTASYAALADVSSALHTVEPQPQGSIHRLSLCRTAAERFQAHSFHSKSRQAVPHCVLLLGVVSRERIDTKIRPKTSLSSTTNAETYCSVAKVHAVWEPPLLSTTSSSDMYPWQALQHVLQSESHRVLRIARHLGLQPVGWMFSYTDARTTTATSSNNSKTTTEPNDNLPVFAQDMWVGATLQAQCMQSSQGEHSHFCTVCMQAATGATEVFQLSHQAVQMVAEDVWSSTERGRHVVTRIPILVDGKQTHNLDTVLCLVNTALLSHVGWYAGASASSSVKRKDGSLTTKTRKSLLQALHDKEDAQLLTLLSDFQVILALDEILGASDSEKICACVRKWARGQRKGTVLDAEVKRRMETMLK